MRSAWKENLCLKRPLRSHLSHTCVFQMGRVFLFLSVSRTAHKHVKSSLMGQPCHTPAFRLSWTVSSSQSYLICKPTTTKHWRYTMYVLSQNHKKSLQLSNIRFQIHITLSISNAHIAFDFLFPACQPRLYSKHHTENWSYCNQIEWFHPQGWHFIKL